MLLVAKCENFVLPSYKIKILHVCRRQAFYSECLGYILLVMVVYFLLSIVNSTAQSYAKRLDKEQVHRTQNS